MAAWRHSSLHSDRRHPRTRVIGERAIILDGFVRRCASMLTKGVGQALDTLLGLPPTGADCNSYSRRGTHFRVGARRRLRISPLVRRVNSYTAPTSYGTETPVSRTTGSAHGESGVRPTLADWIEAVETLDYGAWERANREKLG